MVGEGCVEYNDARTIKKSQLAAGLERQTTTNECAGVSQFMRVTCTPAHVVADPAVAAEQDGAPRQAAAGKRG